jgi:hypothetical protein
MRTAAIRVATALVGILIVLAPSLAAQDWTALWRDPEVENYQLTMEKIRKFAEVQRAVGALNASDPNALPKIDAEFKAMTKGNKRPTVAEAAALLDRHTSLRNTLAKPGTTPREWLLTSAAVGNASLQILLRGGSGASSPRSAVQKANVALLENNQAEWQKIEQELKRLATESTARGNDRSLM